MATYDPTVCLQKLKDKGYTPCDSLSFPYHCDTLTGVGGDYHQECVDAGIIYFPVRVANCHNTATNQNRYFSPGDFFAACNALKAQDPNWQMQWCYCCCACFAHDTLVAVPGGFAEIYTIPVNASVLAASVLVTATGITTSWLPATVKFSEGTGGGGHQPMMVYLVFEGDKTTDLICTPDQPFLLPDGKYSTAGKLRPGQQLVDVNGNAVNLALASIGSYEGGVHHISTDQPWTDSPNGHLILAGGVIAGDFDLQMRFDNLASSLKEDGYEELPLIGTPEYETTHADTTQKSSALFEFSGVGVAGPGAGTRRTSRGIFKTYRALTADPPYGAQSMLKQEQAEEVLLNGVQVPLSNPIAKILFDIITGQMRGFYPDIVFYFDPLEILPNVYAFEAYGKKIVQVTGGLARLVGFNYEGLCMAIAHAVGCFEGGEPRNSMGYSAVGQADRYAFSTVGSRLWIGDSAFNYLGDAIAQWMALFNLIEDNGGNPKDPLNDPSLACRLQTIQAAAFGGGLPECAGGSPKPKIWLEQATAATDTEVMLVFSLALDPDLANDPANYTLVPAAEVTAAKRTDQSDFRVLLTVKLDPDSTYTVTAKNLISIMGTGMDPAHSSTTFDSPTA